MKKCSWIFFLILCFSWFWTNNLLATSLSWEPGQNGGVPTGYKLRVGTTSRSYSMTLDVGNVTEYDMDDLYNSLPLSNGVVYYISVLAYNDDGDSPMANDEVIYGRNVAMGRILTDNDNGIAKIIDIDSKGNIVRTKNISHNVDWHPLSVSLNNNSTGSLLWDNFQGTISIWFLDSNLNMSSYKTFNYTTGVWNARCHTLNSDGTGSLLWDNFQGTISIWFLDSNSELSFYQQYNYTVDTWFLQSYTSSVKGGIFLWDNVSQTPQADSWFWVDDNFQGDLDQMGKYHTTHWTNYWSPLSASIQGVYDTDQELASWLSLDNPKRVVIHYMYKGKSTGKYLDITNDQVVIWFDAR